ncbi:MAG: hypothetical protein U9R19_09370 [Bacteroidota bacterium]|nr:hypothetical protein [Bacteroidota bacterium]
MILRKISLLIALLFSMCCVYAQSTIAVEVENFTPHEYVCTVKMCQSDATPSPTNPPLSFVVPGNTTVIKEYDYDDTDICPCHMWCECLNDIPIAYIDVDCGQGCPANAAVAPIGPEGNNHVFIYDDYQYFGDYEEHYFIIDESL